MSTTLKELVAQLPSTVKGEPRHIGTAVMPDMLMENAKYADIISTEFDTVCVEHHLKWEPMTKRGECRYDFTEADLIVDWALNKGLKVKGHTLVWHVTSPVNTWLREKTDMEIREQVRRHIHTTCGHFYGRIHSWDVVNEALNPNAQFAKTCFTSNKFTPEEFIGDSFRWAKLADPNALLIYNENKVECSTFAKSKAMYALLTELKKQQVPIDAVGLQSHFDASAVGWKRAATPQQMLEQIDHLGSTLQLGVNVSEIDVRVGKLPLEVRDLAQCAVYGNSMKACYQSKHFDGTTFWGFTDKSTWVTKFYSQDQPLLFDLELNKKPAYDAVFTALQELVEQQQNLEDWTQADWAPKSPNDSLLPSKQQKIADLPDWQV